MVADHAEVSRLLKTARGQIDAVLRMVDEDRYCIDVSNQLMAIERLVSKTNALVLKAHVGGCVKAACESGDERVEAEKLQEVDDIIDKLSR